MTTTNLVLVLRTLCEGEVPEITGQGIEQSSDQAALASLIELGALTHIGNAETVLCLGCDVPHSIGVEYAGDETLSRFLSRQRISASSTGLASTICGRRELDCQ